MSSHYDIIIIGSGAGGGTMALALAPTGKRILLLERGNYLRREQDNWDPDAVFVRGKYQAKETWYDGEGRTFHPGLHYFVGGNTKVYGGALFRLRPQDFEEIVHADGLSPAWPVSSKSCGRSRNRDRKSTRLNSSHMSISYAVF